jgi:hypothetical protein
MRHRLSWIAHNRPSRARKPRDELSRRVHHPRDLAGPVLRSNIRLPIPLAGQSDLPFKNGADAAAEGAESASFESDARWAERQYGRLPLLADLVDRGVDVITTAPFPGALAAKAGSQCRGTALGSRS